MPDPTNPADVPASWLSVPVQEKPAAYRRAVARKVKNNRHAKVLDMATVLEDWCRASRVRLDIYDEVLQTLDDRFWKGLAITAGHPCRKVSPETRKDVIDKVRADLAEPYRAKGRGRFIEGGDAAMP